LQQAIPKTV